MFELPYQSNTYIGHVIPGNEDDWDTPEVLLLIEKIKDAGKAVLVYRGADRKKFYALPDGMSVDDVAGDIEMAVGRAV